MSVKIRMTRMGRRHRQFFRINAIESRNPRDGRVLEKLGHYDPIEKDKDKQLVLDIERVRYWLDKGAIPSDTVSDMLLRLGVKHKYAEQKAAKQAKARAIAAAKGKPFTEADRIAIKKAAETEAAAVAEKAKADAASADEKAKAQVEAKEKTEATEAETKAEVKEEPPVEAKPAEAVEEKAEPESKPEAEAEVEEKDKKKAKSKKKAEAKAEAKEESGEEAEKGDEN